MFSAPMPVSAQAPIPHELACTQASTSAPLVCTGKVPSWDDVPLDVDLTLPPGPVTPRPLVVMLHGYGNNKTEWESSTPHNSDPNKDEWNTAWFASRGYAVLTYTARGFFGSCGQGPSTPGTNGHECDRGWTHLADRRFEVRDTQYLAGWLADHDIADPSRIAVTGGSYGGGQSLLLAMQGDTVASVPGLDTPATYDQATNHPWLSPKKGLAMHLAAAVPKYPWSDLVDSLLPNGRASDGVILTDGDRLNPIGIEKQSYVSALYGFGVPPNGYYCPAPCPDPTADLTAWFARVNQGEPYLPAAEPQLAYALDQLKTWRSSYYQDALINRSTDLVPIFDMQGWTDNLFPQVEGVSLVNKLRAHGWPVKVAVADLGHPLAQKKASVWSALNAEGNAFLDHYLTGTTAPALDSSGQVTHCDASAGLTYTQNDWASLAPYRRTFSSSQPGATTSAAGDQPAGALTDPILVAAQHGSVGACVTVPASTSFSGSATWDFPVTAAFTLLGEPALHLDLTIVGVDAEVNSRLWDVSPAGTMTLVTRGAYRFTGSPGARSIDASLQGNGWDFAAGDTIRLQVTQNDAPYLRLDNLPSAISYGGVTLTLPTPTAPPSPTSTSSSPTVVRLAPTGGNAG
ncbi:MAG TPA: CocE/NonD family hydrolase [Candidatus Dormibacteraeota bacterium]|nr:CocE/NonD family hydrolase [Candidatus Dormibacteraeota bacterium]